jgi:hypothetical protein
MVGDRGRRQPGAAASTRAAQSLALPSPADLRYVLPTRRSSARASASTPSLPGLPRDGEFVGRSAAAARPARQPSQWMSSPATSPSGLPGAPYGAVLWVAAGIVVLLAVALRMFRTSALAVGATTYSRSHDDSAGRGVPRRACRDRAPRLAHLRQPRADDERRRLRPAASTTSRSGPLVAQYPPTVLVPGGRHPELAHLQNADVSGPPVAALCLASASPLAPLADVSPRPAIALVSEATPRRRWRGLLLPTVALVLSACLSGAAVPESRGIRRPPRRPGRRQPRRRWPGCRRARRRSCAA